jgi:hypothetical protein
MEPSPNSESKQHTLGRTASSPLSVNQETTRASSEPVKSNFGRSCPSCNKKLTWHTLKRTCTRCNIILCRDCTSKKRGSALGIGVVCRRGCPNENRADLSRKLLGIAEKNSEIIPDDCFGVLTVEIIEGRGLIQADRDFFGSDEPSDPYCTVSIPVDGISVKSRHVNNSDNPIWRETLTLPVKSSQQNIEIFVMDYDGNNDLERDDQIGFPLTEIPLARLSSTPVEGWLPLLYLDVRSSTPRAADRIRCAGAIRIKIHMEYNSPKDHRLAYLHTYLRQAPKQALPAFDPQELYGPLLLVVDLLWWRTLDPVLRVILDVLYWRRFVVSMAATCLWMPLAWKLEYWPAAFMFFLSGVMLYHKTNRSYAWLAKTAVRDSRALSATTPANKPNPTPPSADVLARQLELIFLSLDLPSRALQLGLMRILGFSSHKVSVPCSDPLKTPRLRSKGVCL